MSSVRDDRLSEIIIILNFAKSLENRKFSNTSEINSGKFLKFLWIILVQIHKILVN